MNLIEDLECTAHGFHSLQWPQESLENRAFLSLGVFFGTSCKNEIPHGNSRVAKFCLTHKVLVSTRTGRITSKVRQQVLGGVWVAIVDVWKGAAMYNTRSLFTLEIIFIWRIA